MDTPNMDNPTSSNFVSYTSDVSEPSRTETDHSANRGVGAAVVVPQKTAVAVPENIVRSDGSINTNHLQVNNTRPPSAQQELKGTPTFP